MQSNKIFLLTNKTEEKKAKKILIKFKMQKKQTFICLWTVIC